MKVLVNFIIFFLSLSHIFAYLPIKNYIITPDTIKKIGIYKFETFSSNHLELFKEFQNDLMYELESIPYFNVYNYDRMFTQITDYYKENPLEFLNSFDALAIGEIRSNQSLYIKIYFPKITDQQEFSFQLEDNYDKAFILQLIKKELTKKLGFSGEVISYLTNNDLIINLGENFNIQQNQIFVSFHNNEFVNAVLQVTKVNQLTSYCHILNATHPIASGDTVSFINSDFLKNFYSQYTKINISKNITLTKTRKIWGISGKNIFLSTSPYDNSYVLSDGNRMYFRNFDSHKSRVLEKNKHIRQLEWNIKNKTLAYSFATNLIIYDISKHTKFIYINGKFIPSHLAYKKNHNLILDFKWDYQGKQFIFFEQNKGLFLTDNLKTIEKLSIPDFYNDISAIQIAFSGDNEGLYIKYPNHFNNLCSLIFYPFDTGKAILVSSQLIDDKFSIDKQYRGIIDYELYNNYTNRILVQTTNIQILKPHFSNKLTTSDNDQISFQIKNQKLYLYDSKLNPLHSENFSKITDANFFLSSQYIILNGFIKDTNRDGVIDWKDNHGLYLYDPLLNTLKKTLCNDIDSFLGMTITGQHFFYRKGTSVFAVTIANKK